MSIFEKISLGKSSKTPLILQIEAAECGLACLAMISGHYQNHLDLSTMRGKYTFSLKGASLAQVIHVAEKLKLGTRPVRLEIEDLPELRLPCILHWNFNHFVVLTNVSKDRITILDPAFGERIIGRAEVGLSFTGIALELWPNPEFEKKNPVARVRLRDLIGSVHGLGKSLFQILLLAFAIEAFSLISPFFMTWVIDDVVLSHDKSLLQVLTFSFLILLIMQVSINTMRSWLIIFMSTSINLHWRSNIFSHLLKLPINYFEKRTLGDVVSRFESIDQIQRTLTTSFLEALLDGVMATLTLFLMFYYSPKMALVSISTAILYGIIRWIWFYPTRIANEKQIICSAKQHTHFLETVRGVKAIKLFLKNEGRRAAWLTLVTNEINAGLRLQKLNLYFRVVNSVAFGVENLLVVALGAVYVMEGSFTIGILIAFMAYKNQFLGRASSLIDKALEFKMLQVYGERLGDIVLTEPENSEVDVVSWQGIELVPSLSVRGLKFRYGEQEPWILNGVDFDVASGESVAIVGPSGCGKSTLINVLIGTSTNSRGNIYIGDQDIKKVGVNSFREIVGTVLQDDVLFAGSIQDNISFFDPDADSNWIEECASIAAVLEDIKAMPMGFNSLVGDMGTVLSGGQKQRVLLARALYKRPKILLLDEATSHLDVACEKKVNLAISKLKMTKIIIAHRPETIASADRVLVMENGKIKI
ncbi:peptidase domain-containing ABC transporter [Janthinobacterium sp. PAMC25594]|uniref:peptidase domain-containing ABC transporter n=1 Tax=Janthinobacterium sp. PAMC25594 TaxID=2861284 RepID=UPI001C62CC68|nr:peptidase domain-containing ABC transporter [Janthinobacterium sp. PAMC25594]QYG06805.1 peptidase domain-containing ABC transporter [Janthinobacterium sp. PAMC25594]